MEQTGFLGAFVGAVWAIGILAKAAEGTSPRKILASLHLEHQVTTRYGRGTEPVLYTLIRIVVLLGFWGFVAGYIIGGVIKLTVDMIQ